MSGSIGFQPIPLYLQYAADEPKYADAAMKANTQGTNLIQYFQANAASVTTPAQLLGNYKLLSVVLGAFNMQASINDTAILKQLMTQDPTSSTSLAQKLSNPSSQLFAKALSNWSTPPFANASDRAQIVNSYTINTFEQGTNAQAPGLGNALYFTREASSIKTLTQLQADTNLVQVAEAPTGIPYLDFGSLNFDQQTAILQKSLNVSQLGTPSYVQHLAEQYLIQQQGGGTGSAPAPGSVESLFSDGSAASGDDLLSILEPSSGTDTSLSGSSSGAGNLLSLFT